MIQTADLFGRDPNVHYVPTRPARREGRDTSLRPALGVMKGCSDKAKYIVCCIPADQMVPLDSKNLSCASAPAATMCKGICN